MDIREFDVIPCTEVQVNGFLLQVFQARKIGDDWASKQLRDAVLSERRTYLRYGGVELIDQYDDNAAIYLVCALRKKNGVDVEERFSIRFVSGQNMSLEEAGNFLSHKLTNVPFFAQIQQQMSFASRACGGVYVPDVTHDNVTVAPRMFSTPYAFALSIDHFFRSTSEGRLTGFLLAIIREEVYKHSLSTSVEEYRVPRFVAMDKLSEWKQEDPMFMNRTKEIFSYPRYFLEYDELRILLKRLVGSGRLSPETLARHVGGMEVVDVLTSEAQMNGGWTKNLGALLTQEGVIADSTISGEELRKLINIHVGDGPKLRILHRMTWSEDFLKLMLGKNNC